MTKPRVISKAAMRRAKRQRVKYIAQYEIYSGDGEMYQRLRLLRCGVHQYLRGGFHGDLINRNTYLPIGRGGNRNPIVDWSSVEYEDYKNQVMNDFYTA